MFSHKSLYPRTSAACKSKCQDVYDASWRRNIINYLFSSQPVEAHQRQHTRSSLQVVIHPPSVAGWAHHHSTPVAAHIWQHASRSLQAATHTPQAAHCIHTPSAAQQWQPTSSSSLSSDQRQHTEHISGSFLAVVAVLKVSVFFIMLQILMWRSLIGTFYDWTWDNWACLWLRDQWPGRLGRQKGWNNLGLELITWSSNGNKYWYWL